MPEVSPSGSARRVLRAHGLVAAIVFCILQVLARLSPTWWWCQSPRLFLSGRACFDPCTQECRAWWKDIAVLITLAFSLLLLFGKTWGASPSVWLVITICLLFDVVSLNVRELLIGGMGARSEDARRASGDARSRRQLLIQAVLGFLTSAIAFASLRTGGSGDLGPWGHLYQSCAVAVNVGGFVGHPLQYQMLQQLISLFFLVYIVGLVGAIAYARGGVLPQVRRCDHDRMTGMGPEPVDRRIEATPNLESHLRRLETLEASLTRDIGWSRPLMFAMISVLMTVVTVGGSVGFWFHERLNRRAESVAIDQLPRFMVADEEGKLVAAVARTVFTLQKRPDGPLREAIERLDHLGPFPESSQLESLKALAGVCAIILEKEDRWADRAKDSLNAVKGQLSSGKPSSMEILAYTLEGIVLTLQEPVQYSEEAYQAFKTARSKSNALGVHLGTPVNGFGIHLIRHADQEAAKPGGWREAKKSQQEAKEMFALQNAHDQSPQSLSKLRNNRLYADISSLYWVAVDGAPIDEVLGQTLESYFADMESRIATALDESGGEPVPSLLSTVAEYWGVVGLLYTQLAHQAPSVGLREALTLRAQECYGRSMDGLMQAVKQGAWKGRWTEAGKTAEIVQSMPRFKGVFEDEGRRGAILALFSQKFP